MGYRRRLPLLLVAFLAGSCIALLQGTSAQPSLLETKAAAVTTAANVPSSVQVTVSVEGTVSVLLGHGNLVPGTSANKSEASYYLYDKATAETTDLPTISLSLRVDFGDSGRTLKTGDLVVAPITFEIPADQAEQLDLLTPDATAGSSAGRRRLLSEEQEAVRRMVLDRNNTRRSVQELLTALDVLKIFRTAGTIKSADAPVIIENGVAKDLFVSEGSQQHISSLTFIFKSTACGANPVLNAKQLRPFWFDTPNSGVAASLQTFYRTCSFDQVTFLPENGMIFDGLDIPCVGKLANGDPYNLREGLGDGRSPQNERMALAEFAMTWLARNHPTVRWSAFRRKIFFFPFNYFKGWYGAWAEATLGCASDRADCYIWFNNNVDNLDNLHVTTVFQELGHNIGMHHSTREPVWAGSWVRQEYGDPSCPMGGSVGQGYDKMTHFICLNAPQSYKAGWSKPMPGGHISAAADLRLGVPRELTLPPMYSSKRNFVRIITDLKVNYPIVGQAEANFKQRALYVAYRPGVNGPGAYDSGLAAFPPRNSLVWVHEFNDTDDRYPTFNENDAPNFLAALSGEAAPDAILDWSDLPKFDGILVYRSFRQTFPGLGGIAITYKSHTPQAAQVIVCRFSESKETSCGDGNDNDCDGLVDRQDPDCANTSVASRSPPPPPPPSPPPPRPPPPSPPPPPPPSPPPPRPPPPPPPRPPPPSPPPPPPPPPSPPPPRPPPPPPPQPPPPARSPPPPSKPSQPPPRNPKRPAKPSPPPPNVPPPPPALSLEPSVPRRVARSPRLQMSRKSKPPKAPWAPLRPLRPTRRQREDN